MESATEPPVNVEAEALATGVLAGQLRSAARACRWVDDEAPGARALLRRLYPASRAAWLIGITGTPGAGKSTLTSALVARFRAEGKQVGVVAVDPTSPFSGGAILGDRIRMQGHFEDPGVFIRSVATRGALGGLSQSAADLAVVLAAWGAEVVLLETVGVGQDELEVASVADSIVVVVTPGLGDDIQALKAGILECADVFAVNKADQPGAHAAVRHLELMLSLGSGAARLPSRVPGHGHLAGGAAAPALPADAAGPDESWTPPIVRTVASADEGIEALYAELVRHRALPAEPRRALSRSRRRLVMQLRRAMAEVLEGRLAPELDAAAARLAAGAGDPYSESERLLELWRRG